MNMELNDETQKIYDAVPTTEASFNLPLADLELKDKLGAGCFGCVLKGIYKRGGQKIPVAVKTLKLDDETGKVLTSFQTLLKFSSPCGVLFRRLLPL